MSTPIENSATVENSASDEVVKVNQTDFYQLLGVSREASLDEIKKQYRKLSLLYHPDKKSGDEVLYSQINLAFKVLSDEKKRKKYDASLAGTFDELREAERDLKYHRNDEFMKVNQQTGQEEFDQDKFAEQFKRQNTTLDHAFQAPVGTLDDLMAQRAAERDLLMSEMNRQTGALASGIQGLGTEADRFNNNFNQIFEDLKKRNQALVESNQSQMTGEVASAWNTDLGSSWDPSQQTGMIMTGDSMNIDNNTGFPTNEIGKAVENLQRGILNPLNNDWKVKTPEDLIKARMAEYRAESDRLQQFSNQDFIVEQNPDLLSHLEVDAQAELEDTPLDENDSE